MENEFWINVQLLSFGGNLELMVIPHKKYYEIFLDDLHLCSLRKDKDLNWVDVDGKLDFYTAEIIGSGIDLHYLDEAMFDYASVE